MFTDAYGSKYDVLVIFPSGKMNYRAENEAALLKFLDKIIVTLDNKLSNNYHLVNTWSVSQEGPTKNLRESYKETNGEYQVSIKRIFEEIPEDCVNIIKYLAADRSVLQYTYFDSEEDEMFHGLVASQSGFGVTIGCRNKDLANILIGLDALTSRIRTSR